MVTLKEALKSIKNPKPVDFDPEDFERKNLDSDGSDDDDVNEYEKKQRKQEKVLARAHYLNVGKSKLRQTNDEGLEVNGKRYTGSKVSRRDLYEDEQQSGSEDEEEEEDSEEDSDENSGEGEGKDDEEEEESENDIMDVDSDDEEQDGSDEEEEEEEEVQKSSELNQSKRTQLKELLRTEQQKLVSQISKASKDEAQKGEGIKNQINIYEAILDIRVMIQKGLAAANKIPLTEKKIEKYSTKNTPELLGKVSQNLFDLLDQISRVRKQMMVKDNLIKNEESEDEEDTNDSTVEITTGKRSLETAFGNEQALSKKLKPYRDAVLTKWSKKVQAASGISALNASKFSIQNTNAQTQVASQLADMDRLIKRTQINRSEAKVLGEDDKSENEAEEPEEEDEEELDEKTRIKKRIEKQKLQKKLKQKQILQEKKQKKAAAQQQTDELDQFIDPDSNLKEKTEIYDDLDFYKALLKDLVDRRMADSSVASSVTWTISKKSEKDKNGAEDKFSKDRRLNFKIQEKLQNFDAPRNIIQWTDDQIDELFSGLFGQKIVFSEDENEEEDESEEEVEDDYIVNDGLKIFG